MNNILLESGTGELEVIEFVVNNIHYAINVIKVREVIDMDRDGLTRIPNPKKEIAGLILCRNEILTLIDLKYVLSHIEGQLGNKVIISEFNNLKVSFNIDEILGVHRLKWEDISKPDDILGDSPVIGNILINNKLVLMLDFEKIITNIAPNVGINESRIDNLKYKDRGNIRVAIADDSPLIRKLLKDTLTKTGFTNIQTFDDGKQMLQYLELLKKKYNSDFKKEIDILITDIEMPQMDGLTLTRNIKEDNVLRNLPVIIFSSLITDELRHKGDSVGADAQLSKPDIENLVNTIDILLK